MSWNISKNWEKFPHCQSCKAPMHWGFSPPGDMSQSHCSLVRSRWYSVKGRQSSKEKKKKKKPHLTCISIFLKVLRCHSTGSEVRFRYQEATCTLYSGPQGQAHVLCCEIAKPTAREQQASEMPCSDLAWDDTQIPSLQKNNIHLSGRLSVTTK